MRSLITAFAVAMLLAGLSACQDVGPVKEEHPETMKPNSLRGRFMGVSGSNLIIALPGAPGDDHGTTMNVPRSEGLTASANGRPVDVSDITLGSEVVVTLDETANRAVHVEVAPLFEGKTKFGDRDSQIRLPATAKP
jgi:hypothetical protein